MSYNIIPTDAFKRASKRLIKKYPSLKGELLALHELLTNNPAIGTPIGNNCYKIRVGVKSKGRGKSGGTSVISYLLTEQNELYLLIIYDKSEFNIVPDKLLRQIIASLT